MSHFLMFGFCCQCDSTRDLTTAGRCANCNSDSIIIRKPHQSPEPSVIETLMELEAMSRMKGTK